jgi:DNA repair protein RecO (recombination protein O)
VEFAVAAEKALALVVFATDWSETSRIVTLWTREFGKVRAVAKGGRRLRSSFENALDLLTLCRISLLRKSSGSLDLLTEAQLVQRFGQLSRALPALYAGYYVAELLASWTEDYDPHPALFDEAVRTLEELSDAGDRAGPRLAAFELTLLRELGYGPVLETCTACARVPGGGPLAFSAAGGGVLCPACQANQRDRRPLSAAGWQALRTLTGADGWRNLEDPRARAEVRQALNYYETSLLGRRPRLLPYLGS